MQVVVPPACLGILLGETRLASAERFPTFKIVQKPLSHTEFTSCAFHMVKQSDGSDVD
jgi:hypothetical protein